jgi:glyoxylase-like metal-dependent hydrolase (beta-lactamase superfamily II)
MRMADRWLCAALCAIALACAGSCIAFGKKLSAGCEIYALQYGTSTYPARSVYADDRSDDLKEFTWLVYLIKLDSRLVLIDTGFSDTKLLARFRIGNFADPIGLLAELDIGPEQITDLIITHTHFDHVLLAHRFTGAHIHMQARDYHYIEMNEDVPSFMPVCDYLKKNKRLLSLVAGNESLCDDIDLRLTGGHTCGSQIAVLSTRLKTYYFIGDESYLLEGVRQGRGNALYDNRERNMEIIREMQEKLGDPRNEVLPMHDPEIMKRFPHVTPNIVKIL